MTTKKLWSRLNARDKRRAVVSLILGALILVALAGYKFNKSGVSEKKDEESKRDISLDPKMLEESLYMEITKEKDEVISEISQIRKELEEMRRSREKLLTRADEARKEKASKLPPPPPKPPGVSRSHKVPPPPPRSSYPPLPQIQTVILGEIQVVSNGEAGVAMSEGVKKNQSKNEIYLPPSFMEATLLSGLDAPVVKEAKNNPVPVLIRIKNLAVLPNRLKANLKGCFVIAEGYGSLSDERAHLRLVSLSCIAKNGQAAIDQKLKGFVVDEDGKIGLKGTVVSKMGATIARSALAGFFGGIGDGLRAAATAQSISPLGTTQTILNEDIAMGAFGSGIASGFDELQKFYLELARQSMPVIEVGATKTITLVVSEGVSLEIKDYCIQGGESC